MRLLSYNVKSCQLAGPEPIAEALLECDADLVGLQEVDRGTERAHRLDQASELARLAGYAHASFGPATPWPGGGEYGIALLSRYPLDGVRTWPLQVAPPSEPNAGLREPRALLSATVRPPDAAPLRVFVTHFGLAPEQRTVQAREAAAAIDQASVHARPVLLADLNAAPADEELRPLRQQLTDAHDGLARRERGTFPAGVPLDRADITDYVLLDPDVRVRHAMVRADAEGRSDHNLVLADVEPPRAVPG